MIVRPRPHWIHLLFVRRGSLVRRILPQQSFVFLLACAVVAAHGQLFHWKIPLNASPFSLMGVALAIFLGFRINASYDRYWEGRKLWGAILVAARNLSRQALATCGEAAARPFVLGLIAFAAALRNQLRDDTPERDLAGRLPPSLIADIAANPLPAGGPNRILLWLSAWLQDRRRAGQLDPLIGQNMEQGLDALCAAQGGCERIANTPLPFTYSVILHRSSYLYCMLLPFGLVDAIGWMTPLIVAFVSYTFFALEALSDEIEEPFGRMPNDLALDALVHGITANLLDQLGDPLPPAPKPDGQFVLS